MKPTIPFDRPFTLSEARARGITRASVRGWLERGEARQIAYGLYGPCDIQDDRTIRVTRAVVEGRTASSYLGAAQLHGLLVPPEPHPPWQRPIALERIPAEQRWRSGDLRLSSPAWTAVTLARHQPLPSALVPLDSALRNGVPRDALLECAGHMRGWPGSGVLRAAVKHADPLSESALESVARGGFILGGLPAPTLQAEVVTNRRRYRLDFLWPRARLILEADGMVKYSEGRVMVDEKRRHNDLQSAGYTVLRCGFTNVYPHATALVAQIRRILAA